MVMFKTLGLLFVFLSFSGFGFLKALDLRKRVLSLKGFLKGFYALAESVALSKYEASHLLNSCFGDGTVYIKDGKIVFCEEGLQKQDVLLLKEFFDGFGLQRGESEAQRCRLYSTLLSQKYTEADEKLQRLFKLYSSLGILSGLFVCIFLA